jgi:serine phosphatase RsbU (regulator of sigma subunit)
MTTAPKANILMVDDTPNNLLVLEATLAGLGENLVRARSGNEALRRLLQDDYAVILMDAQMPGIDGFETAQLIRGRDRCRHVPIIFLTAFERTDAQLFKGYSVGAVDFLFKPIVPEVLRTKVRVFVDLFRQTERIRRQSALIQEAERREHERRLAEERVRLMLLIAQEIQRKLFPGAPPAVDGFDIHGLSHPAEATGGDYFDYIPLPDSGLGIAVGDVCGHGFGPALLMATTRAYLRALMLSSARVGEVLGLVNRALAADVTEGRFVTLFLARLDPSERTLVYTSAGHPPGYVLAPDGSVRAELASTGLPLGIVSEADFPEAPSVVLEPGDLVLLLTDGIVEASDPLKTQFGTDRALEVARAHRHRPAREIVEAISGAVREFIRRDELPDDITGLVIKVGPDPDRVNPP